MSPERAPGWYPDANVPGYERWWDGGAWSHVTRPAPGAPQAAAPVAAAAAPQPPAPQSFPGAGPSTGTGGWGAPGAQPPYDQPQQPFGQPQQPYGQPQQPYGQPPYYPAGPAGAAPPYAGYPRLGPTTPDGRLLAPQGLRLLARILDAIVTGAVSLVLGWSYLRDAMRALNDYMQTLPTNGPVPSDFFTKLIENQDIIRPAFTFGLISSAITAVYFVVLTALRGATVGKMAVGVKVTPLDRDGRPSWGQSLLRWVMTDVPAFVLSAVWAGNLYLIVDSLWCLWDGKRQCVHDKLPKTVVVRSR